jgi:hypothetical protein
MNMAGKLRLKRLRIEVRVEFEERRARAGCLIAADP